MRFYTFKPVVDQYECCLGSNCGQGLQHVEVCRVEQGQEVVVVTLLIFDLPV